MGQINDDCARALRDFNIAGGAYDRLWRNRDDGYVTVEMQEAERAYAEASAEVGRHLAHRAKQEN